MPSGRRGRFAHGTTVLEAGRSLGVYIESVCGGRGICGRCQIQVTEGEFAKHGITSAANHLSPFSETEGRYVSKRGELEGRRGHERTKNLSPLWGEGSPRSRLGEG